MNAARRAWKITVRTLARFWRERTWRMAASFTFYVLLMLGPLLALQLRLAGSLMDEDAFRDQVLEVVEQAVGEEGAEAVDDLLENFSLPRSGWASYAVGFWMLLFGGVNAMGQLRQSLRRIWRVSEDEEALRSSGVQMLLDMGFVFLFALGLVASVLFNSVLVYARSALEEGPPLVFTVFRLLDLGTSIALLTVLFAVIFRVLPAERLPWPHVWIGAGVTAGLFGICRYLVILWLSHADLGSVYGSVTFFIVLMTWVYLSAQLLLFGGCFTYEIGQAGRSDSGG